MLIWNNFGNTEKLYFLLISLQIKAQTIVTVAGNGGGGYSGDNGLAISAQISPNSFTLDSSGNIYIADNTNYRIRKINTSGIITTIAGVGTMGYSGDGGPATIAEIGVAHGIIADLAGNIYFTEWANHTVRKINTSGIITTIAGTGLAGFGGDGGPATAAQLAAPGGLLIDKIGNIYVCEVLNNHIRKIHTSGIITSIAGTGVAGGYSGDGGPATIANLKYPSFCAWGPDGGLYFCQWPHAVIRKIDNFGIINTVAGNGTTGYSGDGGAATNAQLNHPTGIAVDTFGNIYISECFSHVIRKVDAATGIIQTISGNGIPGYTGDGGPISAAQFRTPNYLFFDKLGNLYINDADNYRIRRIIYNPVSVNEVSSSQTEYLTFPNPATGLLHVGNVITPVNYNLTNTAGAAVKQGKLTQTNNTIDMLGLPIGTYLLQLSDDKGNQQKRKVIKM